MGLRFTSALFYALTSILVVFVNKILLTTFKPFLVLALGQMFVSVFVLTFGRLFNLFPLPRLELSNIKKVFPLSVLYLLNLVMGLGGIQRISLPMFIALRRFSILMTMCLELLILRQVPTLGVEASVFLMILGALIAALSDWAFDAYGYTYILLNDLFTALNGVYMKKKLNSKEFGETGLLFFNSLLMLPFLFVFIVFSGEHNEVLNFVAEGQMTVSIATCFLISCLFGSLLNYSTILCTAHNSALTTCCIGTLKNIAITYVGMLIGGDYVFTWTNFTGLNVSMLGAILYAYVTFRSSSSSSSSKSCGDGTVRGHRKLAVNVQQHETDDDKCEQATRLILEDEDGDSEQVVGKE